MREAREEHKQQKKKKKKMVNCSSRHARSAVATNIIHNSWLLARVVRIY